MNAQLNSRITRILLLASLLGISIAQAQYTQLHDFSPGTDGSLPMGDVTINGSILYGMTREGGTSNLGVVFQMNTDGTAYNVLHTFTGGGADGADPYGSLLQVGGTFYGMTFLGGDNNRGTVFQMNTNGTGFALLHEFSAGADGAYPFGSLTLAGSTLYGVTSEGGSANDGIVFQIDLDGSGYSVLHTFTGGTDGGFPVGPLTLVGTNLYGMTSGRSSFGGTLYKIATNGTGYTPLYQFATAGDEFPSDPHGPAGGLTLVGSTLYGMTDSEGSSSNGTIFKINLDGSGFTNLHLFLGGSTDGSHPDGSLTLVGSTLYGMTAAGGISNEGVIFQVETNGFSYQLLHMFKGGAPDGTEPHGSLVMSDTALYGMTAFGGSNNTCTIFKYDTVPEPSSFILVCAGALLLMARRRQ